MDGDRKLLKRLRRELRSRVVQFLSLSLDGEAITISGSWSEIDVYLHSLIDRWLENDGDNSQLDDVITALFSDESLDEIIRSQEFIDFAMKNYSASVEQQFINDSSEIREQLVNDFEMLGIEMKIVASEIKAINLINSQ